jgi:hypothetical protein
MIGHGAVLYDTREPERRRCCIEDRRRHLYHVVAVYEEQRSGEVRFSVMDGTHTTREYIHADDLLAAFEPAGFSIPTGVKPTYILTREHGVRDGHDLMQRVEGDST